MSNSVKNQNRILIICGIQRLEENNYFPRDVVCYRKIRNLSTSPVANGCCKLYLKSHVTICDFNLAAFNVTVNKRHLVNLRGNDKSE